VVAPMATTGFFGLDELLDELDRVEEMRLLQRRSQLGDAMHPWRSGLWLSPDPRQAQGRKYRRAG
jgi:hypothetical protein